LKPKLLQELRPGTRIVAHDFGFKDWTPDRSVNISKNLYLYIVPARAGGAWKLEADLPAGAHSYQIDVQQDHQKIRGGARIESSGGFLPLFEARLEGDRIRFALVDDGQAHHFDGVVRGGWMEGTVRTGIGRSTSERRWRAERIGPAGE